MTQKAALANLAVTVGLFAAAGALLWIFGADRAGELGGEVIPVSEPPLFDWRQTSDGALVAI